MLNKESVRKITKVIDKLVEKFDCKSFISEDFCYYPGSSTIGFSFVVSEEMDRLFMLNLNTLKPEVNCDIFLWSLLHEIGHHETIDDFEDEELDEHYDFVSSIKEEDPVERKMLYFQDPVEMATTRWAVKYANSHKEELSRYWKNELQPAIFNFYATNCIVD